MLWAGVFCSSLSLGSGIRVEGGPEELLSWECRRGVVCVCVSTCMHVCYSLGERQRDSTEKDEGRGNRHSEKQELMGDTQKRERKRRASGS